MAVSGPGGRGGHSGWLREVSWKAGVAMVSSGEVAVGSLVGGRWSWKGRGGDGFSGERRLWCRAGSRGVAAAVVAAEMVANGFTHAGVDSDDSTPRVQEKTLVSSIWR
jgi:hypothetical protein